MTTTTAPYAPAGFCRCGYRMDPGTCPGVRAGEHQRCVHAAWNKTASSSSGDSGGCGDPAVSNYAANSIPTGQRSYAHLDMLGALEVNRNGDGIVCARSPRRAYPIAGGIGWGSIAQSASPQMPDCPANCRLTAILLHAAGAISRHASKCKRFATVAAALARTFREPAIPQKASFGDLGGSQHEINSTRGLSERPACYPHRARGRRDVDGRSCGRNRRGPREIHEVSDRRPYSSQSRCPMWARRARGISLTPRRRDHREDREERVQYRTALSPRHASCLVFQSLSLFLCVPCASA